MMGAFFDLVPRSEALKAGKKVIGCRFVRKIKWSATNPMVVDKLKSRLVAQGLPTHKR